jgi:predicted DNA-binding WGR domain protein
MTTVILHRIDPARNMARFYALDVQPDLFACILLVKAWGRIGGRGRVVHEPHATGGAGLRRTKSCNGPIGT